MNTEAVLIDQYIAANGVRRFERGDSGDYQSMRLYLATKGYELTARGRYYAYKKFGQRGAGKRVSHQGAVAIVDKFRVEDGLEPIIPADSSKSATYRKRAA